MLLIWGRRLSRRKLGFVAEHCPRCKAVRTVRIDRLGVTSHLFFISLGAGPLLGFRGECRACSGQFDVFPMDYAAFDKNAKATPESLLSTTNPRLLQANASGRAEQARAQALRDPLLRFEASLRDRYQRGNRIDLTTGLGFAASVVVPLLLGWLSHSLGLTGGAKEAVGWLALGVFLVGLVTSFVLLYREPRRFFQRQLRPEIKRALQPLKPEPAELDACLGSLRKYGYRISRFVTSEGLVADLRSA
jgi:hypothetical protein